MLVLVDRGALTAGAVKKYKDWMKENDGKCKFGYLFDDFKLDEIAVTFNGDLDISLICGEEECGQVYVGIKIPFEVWFGEFMARGGLDTIIRILNEQHEKVSKALELAKQIKKMVRG